MDAMQKFRGELRRFFESMWPAEEKPIVFGEGQWHSPEIMLIGEAPGEQETLQGRPFVGKAGKNLDGFLSVVASAAGRDLYLERGQGASGEDQRQGHSLQSPAEPGGIGALHPVA